MWGLNLYRLIFYTSSSAITIAMFGKNKDEKTQEDEKPYVTNNPNVTDIKIENDGTVQDVPKVGNEVQQPQAQQNFSSNSIDQARLKVKQAKEEQRIFGKFFQLEIGEETIATINAKRGVETFKVKMQNGDLADQFRFWLVDIRAPEREKTWDVYANTADQILSKMDEVDKNGNPKHTMTIKCVASQTNKRKYVIEDAN